MAIPDFQVDGYLPEGVHVATLEEIEHRFGWNESRRRLFDRVREWVVYARTIAAPRVLLNGSFVTSKEQPNDVDAACLLPDDFDEQRRRGKVEAVLIYSMLATQYPQEIYAAFDEADWNGWVVFFSRTRGGGEVRKGVCGGDPVIDQIENDATLSIVQEQVVDLKEWRDRVLHDSTKDAFKIHLVVAGIEKKIAHLEREIDEYERTRANASN